MTHKSDINQIVEKLLPDLLWEIEEVLDTSEKIIELIQGSVSKLSSSDLSIKFYMVLIEKLEIHLKEHIKTCSEQKKKIPDCAWENHFNEAISYCKKEMKAIIKNQAIMKFDDKLKLIYEELASRQDREGELSEVLNECDISYIENDLIEFVDYFKKSETVRVLALYKGGTEIVLTQSGLDSLKEDPKQNLNPKVHYGDIITGSIVAKGNEISQPVDLLINQGSKNAIITKKSQINKKNKVSKTESKSAKWQKIGVWVMIVIGVITIILFIIQIKSS